MRILVDLDNTLNFMWQKTALEANKRFGDNFNPDTLEAQGEWEFAHTSKGGKKVYDLWLEPGFFLDVPVFKGALDVLPRLAKNHEIQIVTSSWTTVCDDKRIWIETNFPFLRWKDVMVTSKKYMVEGDMLFDDNADDNLKPWQDRWTDGVGVAMAAGYNKNWPIRVRNWYEFEAIVRCVEVSRNKLPTGLYLRSKCRFVAGLMTFNNKSPEEVMNLLQV